MNGIEYGDRTWHRASWIIGRSRIATLLDAVVRRLAASVGTSRWLEVARDASR